MIRFLDPRAEPATPPQPYDLALTPPRAGVGEEVAIALLANGFPDSVAFLDAVGEALAAILPGAVLHRYDKGNASIAAPESLVEGISRQCKAVVAAYGH
ncbi:MAG: hypothetical protein DWQ36_06705 [Acidobacteria bacterium]|nr:MAG: hypothetical protein DWQ30_24140 [Acidobacteriota bacterium]REK09239.1 MAG: hypothetical protein DWQ36_06705 [Acidobacteriota bacterium]